MTVPPDDQTGPVILIKLTEIQGQLNVISEQIKGNSASIGDHESRLRALERARWPLPTVAGVAAVGSAVAAWIAAVHH